MIEHGSSEPPPVSPGVERGHVMAGETVFVLRAKWHARRGFVAPDMAPLDTERDRRDLHPAVLKPSPSAPDRMASGFFVQAATFWPLVRNRGAGNQKNA